MSSTLQFNRKLTLIVATKTGSGLDLSQLRIKFQIKKNGVMTPNIGSFRIYNMDLQAAALIKKEFTNIILQAGYAGNYGVVFSGNIKQCILGRENGTDTFLDVFAGDGDRAYNYAVMNTTIAKGSSQSDHLNAAMSTLSPMGVTQGYTGATPGTKLPRGKVFYGNARDYINSIAQSSNSQWSIQDGKTVFLPLTTYLPGQAVVLTSKTGLVGTPQQTVEGIQMKCLLNPLLKIHGRVQIDNASVAQFQLNFQVPGSAANTPVPLSNDGVYYILSAEHSGDTREVEWYTSLNCLVIDPSSNPLNSVSVQ